MTLIDDDALGRLRAAVREPDLSGTRYRLLGVAGAGGMGTVYSALDTELGRRVALKVLDLDDPGVAARLRQEAQVLARLEHPGIVPVHEVGVLPDGRAFYTMKLVEGERLDQHLAARAPSLAGRLRIFLRIAEAVSFAHARGVLHRDLKPQNVMLGRFGEVLVLDWGLAKVVGGAPLPAGSARPGATRDGAMLGTPGFMSPEQEAGQGATVDERTDVYSLGALLRWLSAPAPPALAAVAAKATAERREDRYPAVAALSQDVARFLDSEAVSAMPEGVAARALRLAKRHRTALGILGAYALGRGLILLFAHR